MLNVYGIKNCNTVKKSLDWLANNNIEFQFHDVKKNTLDVSLISSWAKKLPEPYTWENIVNKSGITWRQLEDNDKNIATDLTGAIELILKKPSVMKGQSLQGMIRLSPLGLMKNYLKKFTYE